MVQLVDTYQLSRASRLSGSVGAKLPSLQPRKLALYVAEILDMLLARYWEYGNRHLSFYTLVAQYRLRQAILKASLPLKDLDLVICEIQSDAGILSVARPAKTLYDCPAPWADELYFTGRLTGRQHTKMRRLETDLFESVDHLSFHWESYTRYVLEQYGISGHNVLTLNFGCTPSARRAQFDDPPRIVYVGNLTAKFNNLPLLVRLSELYPHIDVYGGPEPDPRLGLNYLGYSPSLDVLRHYQLGLVTCSRDELRQQGFSSKHTNYLAYGLPVLVPQWRRHLDLLRGSVPYTEETFRSVINSLSDEKHWQSLSDQAYAQARRLEWDRALAPLEGVLEEPDARAR